MSKSFVMEPNFIGGVGRDGKRKMVRVHPRSTIRS